MKAAPFSQSLVFLFVHPEGRAAKPVSLASGPRRRPASHHVGIARLISAWVCGPTALHTLDIRRWRRWARTRLAPGQDDGGAVSLAAIGDVGAEVHQIDQGDAASLPAFGRAGEKFGAKIDGGAGSCHDFAR